MNIFRTLATATAISLCALGAQSAHAQAPATPAPAALMTEKKVFSMPSYTTFGGKTIKNVRVGYETYGTFDAKDDNAIFIAHFYSGNSHAAGKYNPVFIPAQSDLVFSPEMWQKAAAKLRGLGKSADVFVIEGDGGHLDGALAVNKAAEVIRAFSEK